MDTAGRVYVAVRGLGRVIRIDPSSEGVEVLAAPFGPTDVAVDTAGKLSIVFQDGQYIDTSWVARFAGPGSAEWAWQESFSAQPTQIAVDATGDVYVADGLRDRVVRLDSATGRRTAVLGTDDPMRGWDGGQAESVRLAEPRSVAVDNARNVFFTDSNRVWKLDASGMVAVLAGNGWAGYSDDSAPAAESSLYPRGLAADAAGRVYITDGHRVRRVDPDGTITTVAGTRQAGYSGDGGPATEARLHSPGALALDSEGGLYIADAGNDAVRKIDPAGRITTLVEGLSGITDLAADSAGNLFVVASRDHSWRMLWRIDTATGNRERVSSEDSRFWWSGRLNASATADRFGNVYSWDGISNRIRLLGFDGAEKIIAGDGRSGFSGDADRATDVAISVTDMAADGSGAVWILDAESRRIRVLEPRGAR